MENSSNNSVNKPGEKSKVLPIVLGILVIIAGVFGIRYFLDNSRNDDENRNVKEESIKRGKINTFSNNLKVYLGNNEFSPISQDKLDNFRLLNNVLKNRSDIKDMPSSMLTDANSSIKRGIITMSVNNNIAVVLYNDYRFIVDPDKVIPFNFSFNSERFVYVDSYHFAFNVSDAISEADKKSLSNLKKFIANNKSTIEGIFITGHTCSIGNYDYNLKLSIKRAQYIADNLCDTGINVLAI